MVEKGGVGIIFSASRASRCLLVKSLVPGGAAEKACAVEIGHQIIAIGDTDVSSSTLEEVAAMLRGAVGSEVSLKFLETRQVKLTMERCVFMNDGTPSVGICWKDGSSEMIVEGMMPGYQGFGGTPKRGDRLLSIDNKAIEHMQDDEIWEKLSGIEDSSVRLEFARGVAHHSVSLVRQTLSIVPSLAAIPADEDKPKTIEAAPLSLARDLARDPGATSPAKNASPTSSNGDYLAYQEQSPPPHPVPDRFIAPLEGRNRRAQSNVEQPLELAAINAETDTTSVARAPDSQPLHLLSPNKEMPFVIKTKSAGAANSNSANSANASSNNPNIIPRIGVNSRINPAANCVQHFSGPVVERPVQRMAQRSAPPPPTRDGIDKPRPQQTPATPIDPAADDDYLPAVPQEQEENAGGGYSAAPMSGDPTQLVLKKQLVDIAKRLKREVEEKDQEIFSLREAQGDPDALQKLVEKGQEQIRALRDRLSQNEKKLADMGSSIKHKDAELASVKGVLMRRAEKSGESKQQLEDLTATFVALGEEKKALAIANDMLQSEFRKAQERIQRLEDSRDMEQKSFRDAAEMTVKWQMVEVEKQLQDLRGELKIKRTECAGATAQVHKVSEDVAREQARARSSETKLTEAMSELKRMRESNSKYDASAKEYKAQSIALERELVAAGGRSAELLQNVQDCKDMLEEASILNAEKLKNNDTAWEGRVLRLQQQILQLQEDMATKQLVYEQDASKTQVEHDTLIEDHNLKYALLQSEMEEARCLMEEARNKILSLEDEKKEGLHREEKVAMKLAASGSKVMELESEVQKLNQNLEEASLLHKESVEEMQATHLDEEASLQQQLAKMTTRSDNLVDSNQKLKESVAECDRTIQNQSNAISEERSCSDEYQTKAAHLESQVKGLQDELKSLHSMKYDLDAANGRLRSIDQIQSRVQTEAKQREDFRKQFRGPQGIPYQQLARMLEDATVSANKMQGVISSKEQEIIFYKTQVSDLARSREMSVEAERQLWKLKESLDWKTIAVQQMVVTLGKCQESMRKHGASDEEIDQVSSTLSVNKKHANLHDTEIDPSTWPSAQEQQQPQVTLQMPPQQHQHQPQQHQHQPQQLQHQQQRPTAQRHAPPPQSPQQQHQQPPQTHHHNGQQQQPQPHHAQQERPTSFPPAYVVLDDQVRTLSPAPNTQQTYNSRNSAASPTPFLGAPPAPMPLQRGVAVGGGNMGGAHTNNHLYASRDSLSGGGSVQPSAGTYGNNNNNNNNALYASRDSLSGSGMYDSRLGGNAAASWEAGMSPYGSHNGYGGGGPYAPPRDPSTPQHSYREAEAVL